MGRSRSTLNDYRRRGTGPPIPRHQRIVAGVELESYTISTPGHSIGRELAFPRKGVVEKGERFGRDWSIGTEYNSPPFETVREGIFLLKAGLRKYNLTHYRRKSRAKHKLHLLLTGGWRDRFAGTHVHLSAAGEKLTPEKGRLWASHLHDHIPLCIAISANSPVWADKISGVASNRIVRASHKYFKPIPRRGVGSRSIDEMLLSPGRKTKPATIEVRVADANIPEFAMAVVCVLKAASLAWLAGKGAANRTPAKAYLAGRRHAATRGMAGRLWWNGEWIKATDYLDRFFWAYREELSIMDIPQEMWTTFKLLKKGVNGSVLLGTAARTAYEEHPQTWQNRFARRYVDAIDHLLSGNTILDFAERLGVALPELRGVWLGRRRLKLL